MRRVLCARSLLCVLCVTAARPSYAAVQDYIGRPIASVKLFTEGRETTDPVLTSIVETAPGASLSMLEVRESVAHLFSLGQFEGVSVDAELENGRVALRYELIPIHPVTNIRFAGALGGPGIDPGAMRRAIVDRYGVTPPLGRVADMTRILTDALRERGYLSASVVPRPEIEHAPERATLVFTIDPGPRTIIGQVDIVGVPTATRPELLKQLGVVHGAPYQRDALEARIERYVEDRRSRGFYEARVSPSVKVSEDGTLADLTLNVAPGPHVRVVFVGDPLPPDRRAELVPVEREGSVDEDLLEDSSNRIEEFLKTQGYRDATAPHRRETKNNELVVTFTVSRGQQYKVSTFEVAGNSSVPTADFESALRVRSGQPFSEARLDADVQMIEDLYRRRGFAAVAVRPAVEIVRPTPPPAQVPVAVRAAIIEGPQTTVDAIAFSGNQALTDAALRARVRQQAGAPYVPGLVAVDRDAIQLAYQDLGYESATVEPQATFSQNDTHVTLTFAIREGPQVFVDHVLIVGNVRTSTSTISHELQVKPGDPFSLSAINDSQRRLTELGLFRRARITELRHGAENQRDLLVTIEEAPPTTVGYGGGVEGSKRVVNNSVPGIASVAEEVFEVAPRAFFEIGRRNVFGKNRSLNFFSSIAIHPPHDNLATFTEYRLIGTYREPRLFDTAADAFVTATFEQQTRSSFNFARRGVSAALGRRVTPEISVQAGYQLQRTEVFDEQLDPQDVLLIDRIFPKVRLSSFSASVVRDTRSDAVEPLSGNYLSANGQLAARAIGSQVGFVKSFFTAQAFRAIPRTNRVVFAASARLGLADGFVHEEIGENGVVIPGVLIEDLPQSERFYAGGDTTIRGFALDRVGTRHIPPERSDTLTEDLLPVGGNGLVIFNAELRAPVAGGLGVVGFFDTGNVFARVNNIDLGELRSAVGGGVRYKSPFGPIRFDVGLKVNRQPGEGLTAWFVSFGQAF
ncbi:MAG TPA: POTRA domain-containing protein [Vicinamibacterales bacterium]|nr:POTRA domain-containing protein [Vicinamibacterales bacterium]